MTVRSVLCLLAAAAFTVSAQAGEPDFSVPPPKVQTRKLVPLTGLDREITVELTRWRSTIPASDVMGRIDSGLFCANSTEIRNSAKVEAFLFDELGRAFKGRATQFGFAKADQAGSVFDTRVGDAADYRVGATLLAMDYRSCGDTDLKGDAYAKVKWEVFSARRQQVVYTETIEASFSAPRAIPAKEFNLGFMQAIVDNLLGDPRFLAVIKTGGGEVTAERVLPPLQIDPGATVAGGVGKSGASLLEAVVTVEGGLGAGTGFYISHDGYLLTNHHVVLDAKFVRIKLANGHSLVGEVVRVNKARDVALIRTDAVSSGVLALRRESARVGEEVFALGTPIDSAFSGTLTRGVMSARRVFDGVSYLQSDVTLNPGNSGGPLIDADGQVLGVARLGFGQNLNLFIPIGDAVDMLSLTVQARASASTAAARP